MHKISVYIPSHNYGRYLDCAIQSVLAQTIDDWELIVIDDGSTDNTADVLKKYEGHPKIRTVYQKNKGLNVTNNIALRLSNGKYLIRLDADDYMDENILLVLSNMLDSRPEVGLVFPDYYLVDEGGNIIEAVRQKKIGEEAELLDLPAHGACTMIRKEILLDLGGYYEEFNRQDGYGLWLKFIRRYHPHNVNVPLFYYRQHQNSLTKDKEKLLETRRQIKRHFVEQNNIVSPKVLAIIPVVSDAGLIYQSPFTELAGKPLFSYTLDEVVKAKLVDRCVVSSSDEQVLEYAKRVKGIGTILRPEELAKSTSRVEETILHALDYLKEKNNYCPDVVCVCYINTPFRKARHIDKAIDTMSIFDVDSVLSVQEELSFCFHHGRNGLEAINGMQRSRLRLEREAIYKDTGAIILSRTEVIRSGKLVGDKIGHIFMLPEDSIRIRSDLDFQIAEMITSKRNK